jgi:hypothetical protein
MLRGRLTILLRLRFSAVKTVERNRTSAGQFNNCLFCKLQFASPLVLMLETNDFQSLLKPANCRTFQARAPDADLNQVPCRRAKKPNRPPLTPAKAPRRTGIRFQMSSCGVLTHYSIYYRYLGFRFSPSWFKAPPPVAPPVSSSRKCRSRAPPPAPTPVVACVSCCDTPPYSSGFSSVGRSRYQSWTLQKMG